MIDAPNRPFISRMIIAQPSIKTARGLPQLQVSRALAPWPAPRDRPSEAGWVLLGLDRLG